MLMSTSAAWEHVAQQKHLLSKMLTSIAMRAKRGKCMHAARTRQAQTHDTALLHGPTPPRQTAGQARAQYQTRAPRVGE
jgi:hypothetical protein